MQLQPLENRNNDVVLYQSENDIKLEVRFEKETVWLTQDQMSMLFQRDRTVINRHIRNIFEEGELEEIVSCAKFAHNTQHGAMSGKTKTTVITIYNLDVIISVGYRVKSQQGTQFRKWANQIIKEYLLNGFVINKRFEYIENKISQIELQTKENTKQIDFFVQRSLPPVCGVFCDGQIFDAYIFIADLVKTAKKSIILIDNYIDETVLLQLSKRNAGVTAEIYTLRISEQLQLDIDKHNSQYEPITVKTTTKTHDRFLIIDDTVYNIGASLKDLGKKLFAFNKMEISKSEILINL